LILYAIIASTISFIIAFIGISWWIDVGNRFGFKGKDMNKPYETYAVEAGGVWVSFGASFGLLVIIAAHRYFNGEYYFLPELMSLALLLFMASFLGFLDDLLGWKKGLRVWQRVIFMGPLALPMVVIKAGVSTISIPFIGAINLGLLYPLILVPIGILGASNAFNMIAGYNGLEAGMGLVLMIFTFIFSWIKGLEHVAYASLVMAFALAAFLIYNWYPAKTFPGNSLTYGFGAYYASLVILGNFEKFGVLMFTLYFIEFLLFIRGLKHGVYKENFGKVNPDGSLEPPYDRVYSVTHLTIKLLKKIRGKAYERSVTITIIIIQIIISIISLSLTLSGMV